jgi:hypothetical protein
MTYNKDFSLNNVELEQAHEITIGARNGGKLFYFEQLCIKQREEINRLQAENERLQNAYKQCAWERDTFLDELKTAKTEAYKECIEKINKNLSSRASFGSMAESVVCESIILENDNLYKELAGDVDA